MLRALATLLVIVNLGFFAWSQGWLDKVTGAHAHADREPERLTRQVRPELVRVLAAPAAPASGAAQAVAPPACLQAGPFAAGDIAAAEAALKTAIPDLASRGYSNVTSEQPGSWAVYMGKFASADLQQRKEAELARRHLDFERLADGGEWGPGLVLSRHDSLASANEALAQLGRQGIHTAKVIVMAPPGIVHRLRVERADGATQARLSALAEPAFAEHHFERCDSAGAAAASSPGSR